MHGGIFKSNFTAGKRRNKAKALGAKSDVGNALLGMMPLGITDGQGSIGTAVSGCTQAGAFATSETCADELALIW